MKATILSDVDDKERTVEITRHDNRILFVLVEPYRPGIGTIIVETDALLRAVLL